MGLTHSRNATAATVFDVTSCADDNSSGTLRSVITKSAMSMTGGNGDTVDLSALTCGTITLINGEIAIPQINLTLQSARAVTIDANKHSRVVHHTGSGGTLTITGVNLANGQVSSTSNGTTVRGGCLYSSGSLSISNSTISGCTAESSNGQAYGGGAAAASDIHIDTSTIQQCLATGNTSIGGGVYAHHSLYLTNSNVTNNSASSRGGGAGASFLVSASGSTIADNQAGTSGGGIHAIRVALSGSAITGNSVTSPYGTGGGLSTIQGQGASTILNTTIDHNQAADSGGVYFRNASGSSLDIEQSTISNNTATTGSAAIYAYRTSLTIRNSTIAFNVAAGASAGLDTYYTSTNVLESTIISNNASTGTAAAYDLVSNTRFTASANIVRNPKTGLGINPGPDPLLQPLADNASQFSIAHPKTNALSANSPAIDHGKNSQNRIIDERGYPRTVGTIDIGAYEWQGDDAIFQNGFDLVQ